MIDKREVDALMESTALVVREFISTEVNNMTLRMEETERRILANLEQRIRELPVGRDGKDADLDAVRNFINEEVVRGLAALPVPKDGQDGKPGEPGQPGKDGESIKGEPGEPGRDGKNADPEQIRAAVSDEVAKAVAAIPTPKDGKDGKDISVDAVREIIMAEVTRSVAALPPAKDGKDAEPIHPDTIALMVVTEVGKAVERAVAAIPKAKDGDPGRDALQIEILPAIDPAKSFPRGTFAVHAGGLLRSNKKTTPADAINLADWDVIVDGPGRTRTIQGDDPREFLFETRYPSGEVFMEKFFIPMMIHQGVYRDGQDYVKSDAVTWDGSVWLCMAATTRAKPGISTDWKLVVKRGGEGKPGKDGQDGKPGLEGKPGRDLTQMDFDGRKH